MEISDWRNKYFFFQKKMVAEYVAFIQVDMSSITEMTMWSTTGFSLQHQSLINQTCDQNYGNHPLEDVDLLYQQILKTLMSTEMDSEGELTVWTLKMVKDTMYVKIYLLPWMAEKT